MFSEKANIRKLIRNPYLQILVVALAILACYLHTLTAPWYYDDFNNIYENIDIRSLSHSIKNLFKNRGLAYLTFSLNYFISGLDTTSYHLTNILIHIGASVSVYLLLKIIWDKSNWIPVVGTLFFAIHPIQTQAVTYIVQRMTSLYALLFLLSLICFVYAKKTYKSAGKLADKKHILFYGTSLILGFSSGLSKENAALLPFCILAFDFFILEKGKKYKWSNFIYILPFFSTTIFLVLQQFLAGESTLHKTEIKYYYHETNSGSYRLTFGDSSVWRFHYLFTQFIIVWKYVRLYFWPIDQILDYGHPLVKNLYNFRSIVGLSGICLSIATTFILRKKSPIIALGITWYFLTISLESSIFPLDVMYEHRLYLPSLGLIIVFLGFTNQYLPKIRPQLFLPLLVILAILTVQRNQMWNDPVLFWSKNAKLTPHNHRPHNHLYLYLMGEGNYAEALNEAKIATNLLPSAKHYFTLATAYYRLGQLEPAKNSVEFSLKAFPNMPDYLNLYAMILGDLGDFTKSLEYAQRAVTAAPDRIQLYAYLGYAQARAGKWEEAIRTMQYVITFDPQNTLALEILQKFRK
ncbi:MAG: hypothetical protein C0624_14395 [Desulfuromonas sp.]|nr:MAG: hypothetical protein C0624_14395 [Desulfuromonas sp.]